MVSTFCIRLPLKLSWQVLFFTLVWGTALFGQQPTSNWSAYRTATLRHAWSAATVLEGADYTIEAAEVKFAVDVHYTGQHREVAADRRELLKRWAKALNHPAYGPEFFTHEIEVRSGNDAFWLPLQNPLLNPFVQETTDGSRLRLFIMYVGATRDDRVFIINEFTVLPK